MPGPSMPADSASAPPLAELFGSGGPLSKRLRLLHRGGQLLLALPLPGREACTSLGLYAPQRLAPRAGAAALRLLLAAGLPAPLRTALQPLDPAGALEVFCTQLAPSWLEGPGGMGVLAGNPHAPGRRFVLMLFEKGRPAAVIKAGASAEARALVGAEAAFLAKAGRPGILPPLAVLEGGRVGAFAMAPLDGASPRVASNADLERVLSPWLEPSVRMPLGQLAPWARLAAAAGAEPAWRAFCTSAGDRSVSPAVVHGDFAPWNIKIHPRSGAWQVMDWERGEFRGVPGWDWLHFVIQDAVLVRRESTTVLRERLEVLLGGGEFASYARRAGVEGLERALLVGYLLHCLHVQAPTEGLASLGELLHAFTPP